MSIQTSEALVERTAFMLPDMVESDFSNEDFEDMEGLQMSFQRVKIPGSGGLQFEMPGDDPENPEFIRTVEGVILYNHSSNAYFAEGSEYDDITPPLCQSVDGKICYGDPGGVCDSCLKNVFGSDSKGGSGKACKNMRVLYVLQSGDYLPLQLSLPPTSIRPFRNFVSSAFMARKRPVFGSVVQIGLKRAEGGGFTYSVATFKKLYDFTGEELARVRAYAESFKEQVKLMLSERAEQNEASTENAVEVEGHIPASLPDNEDHFSIGVVDGEREELPL